MWLSKLGEDAKKIVKTHDKSMLRCAYLNFRFRFIAHSHENKNRTRQSPTLQNFMRTSPYVPHTHRRTSVILQQRDVDARVYAVAIAAAAKYTMPPPRAPCRRQVTAAAKYASTHARTPRPHQYTPLPLSPPPKSTLCANAVPLPPPQSTTPRRRLAAAHRHQCKHPSTTL